jgi:hypothetical protein
MGLDYFQHYKHSLVSHLITVRPLAPAEILRKWSSTTSNITSIAWPRFQAVQDHSFRWNSSGTRKWSMITSNITSIAWPRSQLLLDHWFRWPNEAFSILLTSYTGLAYAPQPRSQLPLGHSVRWPNEAFSILITFCTGLTYTLGLIWSRHPPRVLGLANTYRQWPV